MMGNLHEWTADPAGTFRGGYYVDTVINGNGCLYATTAHDDALLGLFDRLPLLRDAAMSCESQRAAHETTAKHLISRGETEHATCFTPRDAPRRGSVCSRARRLPDVQRPARHRAVHSRRRGLPGLADLRSAHAGRRLPAVHDDRRRPRTRSSSSTPAPASSRSIRATSGSTSKPFDASRRVRRRDPDVHDPRRGPRAVEVQLPVPPHDRRRLATLRPLFVPMWIGKGVKYADFTWRDAIDLPDLHRPIPRRRPEQQPQQLGG